MKCHTGAMVQHWPHVAIEQNAWSSLQHKPNRLPWQAIAGYGHNYDIINVMLI